MDLDELLNEIQSASVNPISSPTNNGSAIVIVNQKRVSKIALPKSTLIEQVNTYQNEMGRNLARDASLYNSGGGGLYSN